jgi:hypothetical protein
MGNIAGGEIADAIDFRGDVLGEKGFIGGEIVALGALPS